MKVTNDIKYFDFNCEKCDGTDCPLRNHCNSYFIKKRKRENQFIEAIGNYELFD